MRHSGSSQQHPLPPVLAAAAVSTAMPPLHHARSRSIPPRFPPPPTREQQDPLWRCPRFMPGTFFWLACGRSCSAATTVSVGGPRGICMAVQRAQLAPTATTVNREGASLSTTFLCQPRRRVRRRRAGRHVGTSTAQEANGGGGSRRRAGRRVPQDYRDASRGAWAGQEVWVGLSNASLLFLPPPIPKLSPCLSHAQVWQELALLCASSGDHANATFCAEQALQV